MNSAIYVLSWSGRAHLARVVGVRDEKRKIEPLCNSGLEYVCVLDSEPKDLLICRRCRAKAGKATVEHG